MNLNDRVVVKLTPAGLLAAQGKFTDKELTTGSGYLRCSLWQLAAVFGMHISPGTAVQIIEGNEVLFEKELELKKDVCHWKRIAIYLAQCHIATLWSLPKKTAKGTRERFRAIVVSCISFLQGNQPPIFHAEPDEIKICADAQQALDHDAAVDKK